MDPRSGVIGFADTANSELAILTQSKSARVDNENWTSMRQIR